MGTANQVVQEVEIGRAPTAEQLAEWYAEHSIKPEADGTFTEMPYGPTPVEKAVIVDQVRANAQRRDVRNLQSEPYIPRTMVFVAGGPSVADHLDEIKAKSTDPRYDVFTSNMTCKYLLSKGITPKYHVIIDPTEKKAKDLDYDCDDVTLVLGLQCHPAVFDAIGNRKAFKFLAASATDRTPSDVEVAQDACHAKDPNLLGIGGGSMMGTRVMFLAHVMGYRKLEYYGFDGSITYENGRVRNYAYNKQRGENILEVEAWNGRKFFSTIALSRQANELVHLLDDLPGLDVTIHGDSFLANQLAGWKAMHRNADYRISPEYHALQKQMFEKSPSYARSGHAHAARVYMAGSQVHRKLGKCDVLDYGCGRETLREAVEASFAPIQGLRILGYDPNRPGLDSEPAKADVVFCSDVMEHVEAECIDAVLKHICSLTGELAIFVISTRPAVKDLPDGRNAHISLHQKDWWLSFLQKYFVTIESHAGSDELIAVVQPVTKYCERKGLA